MYNNSRLPVVSYSRLTRYYNVYKQNRKKKGRPVVSLINFANRGLPRLVNHFKKDYAAYLTARNIVAIRNMDPVEHAMIMQYNNDGYSSYGRNGYRKRLIEKVGEGMNWLRNSNKMLKMLRNSNNRLHREKVLAETRKSNVPNQYGSVINRIPTRMLRYLRTSLTGKNSEKTPRAQAERDVNRAFNNMSV